MMHFRKPAFNSPVLRDIPQIGKMAEDDKDMIMPFDIKQMAYGGFLVEVEG